jgi:predicted amidohydrolase
MDDLRVTLVQKDLVWEDPGANILHFRQILAGLEGETDLILLPEMFTTGFSINPDSYAETMDGHSVAFLRETAAGKKAAVMATILIMEGKNYYNRLVCAHPDGSLQTYDKRHLFRLSEEFRIMNEGNSREIFTIKGWRVLPLICYDLRFPVWSKNRWEKEQYEYDLLVYLANWPASRSEVWKALLRARAIENQSYVAAVNRIGHDGFGTWHEGDSLAFDPKGNNLFHAESGKELVKTITLSAADLMLFRESFTIGMDWDRFTIH